MEFKKITVGNFAENLDRFRIPLSSAEREKKRGKYPYYGAAKIIDYVDGFTHSGLSVLIAEDGSVETDKGYPVVQLANGEYWVNNHTHVLKGKNDWDTLYLYYALQIIKVSPFVTGAVQKKISQKALNSMELNYFEDPMIRRKIVESLLELDKKIELNTQINQTLEQIAQTIFKSWFIDFDPVHTKANALASGQTLEQATQAAMSVISGKNTQELHRLQTANPEQYQQLWEIAEAFPRGFDEEGVPWGWDSKKVGEVAKIVKGKSYKSSELAPSKTALVTLKSFNRGGGYRLDGLKEYTGNYKEEQEVFAGDLIIAYTDVTQAADVIGKPAMVMSDSCYEHLVISLDVGVVRPKNEKHKYFLYCLAMTDTFQAHTHSFCTGTTVLHLGKDAVPSFEFILPDNKFIELFDEFVLPIFVRINNIIEENKSLEKIRDELLPKLLSGEILNGN
ncbi:restriction endonuclease subunit S [Glaesserella parasuis]|uniref:restriction endonuclease subunit S n=1 Tax=Glaesserella parasuis TaxID=738 RepID=UPI00243664B3|nr:restriction endonuclease subunit S [Glaesserella parasuis]MDG6461202.1 restriction endonuclease subunit S [Glaesserella parasuis]MDG6482579.1 restriction endonuclease subunit S [Glaesserella parasuis]MDG6870523.1 restriction endonuclease subunit S [Glaesserella parasuis]